jgi:Cytochrome c554 and c-prime
MIRSIVLLSLLLAPALPCLGQMPDAPQPATAAHAREGYAGDTACRDCHQEIFESYSNSAHHLASRLPGPASILGKFDPGSNFLRTSNPYLYFVMTATGQGYFQNAVVKLLPSEIIPHKEPFDVVIGSGRKGQTYLYWKGDELFELPVSYWTETHRWINSPGYPDGLANFDKPIIPRCLECHTTYIQSLAPPLNRFARPTVVFGITCEKCHGPGRAHVERTISKTPLRPGEAEDIVNPASLARDRQMDLCALCHAGPGTEKAAAFSFAPGAVLAQYLSLPLDAPDTPDDVHAHQVQQLRSSRCFRSSGLTCMTCHDVHRTQRDVASYADRCLTCHKMESCGKYPTLGSQIARNCVDCHMPLKQSNQIVLDTVNGPVKPQVRTHRIAVYQ